MQACNLNYLAYTQDPAPTSMSQRHQDNSREVSQNPSTFKAKPTSFASMFKGSSITVIKSGNSISSEQKPNNDKQSLSELIKPSLNYMSEQACDLESELLRLQKENYRPIEILTKFNLKVLENPLDNQGKITFLEDSGRDEKNLEGFRQIAAVLSYLNDLKDFRASLITQSKAISNELNQAINDLEFAFQFVSLHQVYDNCPSNVKEKAVDVHQLLSEKLNQLQKEGKVGDHIVLPCSYNHGYFSGGHAFIYEITKISENKFDFKIINTGEGAIEKSSLFSKRLELKEEIYREVGFEKITDDFLNLLFPRTLDSSYEGNKAMEYIREQFNTHLGCEPSFGRIIKAQTKGSCAFKHVSAWIHGCLSLEERRAFKVFVTEKELNALKDADLSGFLSDESKQIALEMGEKALARRKIKLESTQGNIISSVKYFFSNWI